MNSPSPDNQIILDFLTSTNRPIFLTGKAGTGKTTLLRHIKNTIDKNFAVVAPTAVAAINAGGVTLHSFFQIPFGPLIPLRTENGEHNQAIKYSEEKVRLLKCLELLIIDEISMVRADLIDFIDLTLRKVKGSNRPFGGIQLLMIGDLYQLSPIFHDAWHILKDYYQSPYFFDSQAFRAIDITTFTLEKVYRQSDPVFLEILNRIRENNIDQELLGKLNERFDSTLNDVWKDEYITLTTHNNLVTEINSNCLEKLSGEIHSFKANITGDFPKDAYPVDEILTLKAGAQVMFIKNDSSGKKQFYNGKAAKIVSIKNDTIKVQFMDGGSEIEVEREIWQNVKYNLSDTENKINEVNTGSFAQFPFKLAWAITVHKSQGLTFDKAIIDVSAAFAHGHAYVALSRCRSLEGLILKSPVKLENIITDPRVVAFTQKSSITNSDQSALKQFENEYGWNLIHDLLDFLSIKNDWLILKKSNFKDKDEQKDFKQLFEPLNQKIELEIFKIAEGFVRQELSKVSSSQPFDQEKSFIERLKKASNYFIPKLEASILELNKIINLNFYNDPNSDKVMGLITECKNSLSVKLSLFKSDWDSFSVKSHIKMLHSASQNGKPENSFFAPKKTILPKDISNLQLYKSLVNWRRIHGEQKNIPEHTVLSDQTLILIASKLPRNTEQLASVKGVGIGNAVQLGGAITKLVNDYLGTSSLF
ncbi:AAA family ATPase [Pedobacter fastidiosus]|uniref:AAA family ATPase n=1 Tax=Pedobacter fastidiosus TaxID=2765361 RepID=A0ABR7KPD0_9SPHI|nr:AAA family ATPase [Pedobacter fastidiosus]MBC6109950.1 AAA family ATPase [Pedobacter fastidiosus]